MKKAMFPVILVCTILAIMGIQSFRPGSETETNEQQLIAKANQFNQLFPQEKVYLQLDRPSYWAGEDLWFKAYLKNSPTKTSNLYVELLNSRGNVIFHNNCWAQNGMSYGDFHLPDTISSGVYQVRAYTNWMRNFDEEQFFRKDLIIWNLRDKAKTPEKTELKAREVDVQFLPEGGTFLSGVKNRMAFKVIDKNGKGVDAEGVVLDNQRNKVAKFKSGFKGLGSFEITPKPGIKYTSELTVAGKLSMTIDLPIVITSGVAMNINQQDTSRIHLEVNEAGEMGNKKYLLIGQTEGNVCYRAEISTSSGKGAVNIEKKKFPTGIVKFTLFDSNMLPRCERLVFVNHHDQVEVKIEPAEEAYHPRDKVVLDLFALTKGKAPATANLSVSVYNSGITHQIETYPENILTRFFISSELKGTIEEPAYYFKDDSLSTILALDNLMLTHGYRYFEWKEIADIKQPTIAYEPEPGIELKGTAISAILHRPLANGKVTMMGVKSQMALREATADSSGRFVFPNLFFNDTIHVILQARTEKGGKNADVEIDKRSSESPKTKNLPSTYRYSSKNQSNTVNYVSEFSPELLKNKWRLSDTILLRDINVMARNRNNDDGHMRPYLEADYMFNITKDKDIYYNWDQMEMNSPIYRSFLDRGATKFIDGIPEMGFDIPFSWVDKIELVRTAPIPGKGFGPAIYIYIKRGAPNEIPTLSAGITPVDLIGYSVFRKFYSPAYNSKEEKEKTKPDFRSTLYWNPIVQTDEEGQTWVEFYNSDQTGEVQVVVEGVTKDGKLCRGECKYNVKF